MTKQKKTILLVVAVVLIGIVLGIIFSQNGSGKALRAQLDLGNKYLAEEDYENARIAFEKALEIDPKCVEAYLGLADAYVGKGDFESAESILEDAIALFEENGLDAIALQDKLVELQADIYVGNGKLEAAKSFLEESIKSLKENGRDTKTLQDKLVEIQTEIDRIEASSPRLQLKELLESVDINGEPIIYASSKKDIVETYNLKEDERFDAYGEKFYVDYNGGIVVDYLGPYCENNTPDPDDDELCWPDHYLEWLCTYENHESPAFCVVKATAYSEGITSNVSNGLTDFWRKANCSDTRDFLNYLGLTISDEKWKKIYSEGLTVETDMEDYDTMLLKINSGLLTFYDQTGKELLDMKVFNGSSRPRCNDEKCWDHGGSLHLSIYRMLTLFPRQNQ